MSSTWKDNSRCDPPFSPHPNGTKVWGSGVRQLFGYLPFILRNPNMGPIQQTCTSKERPAFLTQGPYQRDHRSEEALEESLRLQDLLVCAWIRPSSWRAPVGSVAPSPPETPFVALIRLEKRGESVQQRFVSKRSAGRRPVLVMQCRHFLPRGNRDCNNGAWQLT